MVAGLGECQVCGGNPCGKHDAVDNPGVVVIICEGVITAKARLVSSAGPLWSGLSVKG